MVLRSKLPSEAASSHRTFRRWRAGRRCPFATTSRASRSASIVGTPSARKCTRDRALARRDAPRQTHHRNGHDWCIQPACRRGKVAAMRAVVQRVSPARVEVEDEVIGADQGSAGLLGSGQARRPETVQWMARKIATLRIFEDANEKMSLSVATSAARSWSCRSSPCTATFARAADPASRAPLRPTRPRTVRAGLHRA